MPVQAYVLPKDAVAGEDAVSFANFPGIWTPGEPIEASELVRFAGFEDAAALAQAVDELGLPLERVEVEAGSCPMPMSANHAPNEEEALAAAEAEEKPARKPRRTATTTEPESGGEA